jgi:hypothetical protein
MLTRKPCPDQLALELAPDDELEAIIAARVAERAESDALHWRFRLSWPPGSCSNCQQRTCCALPALSARAVSSPA